MGSGPVAAPLRSPDRDAARAAGGPPGNTGRPACEPPEPGAVVAGPRSTWPGIAGSRSAGNDPGEDPAAGSIQPARAGAARRGPASPGAGGSPGAAGPGPASPGAAGPAPARAGADVPRARAGACPDLIPISAYGQDGGPADAALTGRSCRPRPSRQVRCVPRTGPAPSVAGLPAGRIRAASPGATTVPAARTRVPAARARPVVATAIAAAPSVPGAAAPVGRCHTRA